MKILIEESIKLHGMHRSLGESLMGETPTLNNRHLRLLKRGSIFATAKYVEDEVEKSISARISVDESVSSAEEVKQFIVNAFQAKLQEA